MKRPQRSVPFSLGTGLFMNFFTIFGTFFFGFGMIFVLIFFKPVDFYHDFLLNTQGRTIEAEITRIKRTNFSEGGSEHHDGDPVYLYCFDFTTRTEKQGAECYSTRTGFDQGDKVQVEYLPENPSVARIEGMRRTPQVAWPVLSFSFP